MQSLQSQIRWCTRTQWGLAGLMLTLFCSFYLFGYRPQSARLHDLTSRINSAQRELTAARSQTRILPDVAGEVAVLKSKLERSKKSIPSHQELPQFIRDVTQLSQQATLRKPSIKPGVPQAGDLVCELPIQLNFEGDFVNVFSFLRNVEEMPRLTRIRGMTIKNKDRERSGQVQVQLAMNIYFSAE